MVVVVAALICLLHILFFPVHGSCSFSSAIVGVHDPNEVVCSMLRGAEWLFAASRQRSPHTSSPMMVDLHFTG